MGDDTRSNVLKPLVIDVWFLVGLLMFINGFSREAFLDYVLHLLVDWNISSEV